MYKLEGRIDSNNAPIWEEKLLKFINEKTESDLVLDAADLEYISSAGLRVLMKARKTAGASFSVINVSKDIYEIFETTGFTELLDVRKKPREISLKGCEVIGKGAYGTVYRIDEDTIVKMYNSPDSIPMIENEKNMAKMAFVKGIPTAISFDIVSADGHFGSVFELLRSKSLNDIIIEEPDRLEEITKTFAGFMKEVHRTEMDPGTLPFARDHFIEYLTSIEDLLDEGTVKKCRDLIMALPDDLHVIHGDFHMKNVMMSDNEPMLIDMDTLSTGQPIFDLQGLYVTYKAFSEDEPDNSSKFLGIDQKKCDYIWDEIIKDYFEGVSDDELTEIINKLKLLAYIRFLHIIFLNQETETELGRLRIKHASERLKELTQKVDNLII